MFGDLGDYGVAESSQSVHPRGNPMSHSTHVGFSVPPTCTTNGSDPSEPGALAAPLKVRLSRAIGVGQSRRHDSGASSIDGISRGSTPDANSTACISEGADALPVIADRPVRSADTRGVGHRLCRALVSNDGRTAAPSDGDWFDP